MRPLPLLLPFKILPRLCRPRYLAYDHHASSVLPSESATSRTWADILNVVFPLHQDNQDNSAEERWKVQSEEFTRREMRPNDSYSGRTIKVHDDLPMAWTRLHRILHRNNIKRDLISQERFEKPGEKRRRLKSERWRRRFSEEVRRKVQLVSEIRRRGA